MTEKKECECGRGVTIPLSATETPHPEPVAKLAIWYGSLGADDKAFLDKIGGGMPDIANRTDKEIIESILGVVGTWRGPLEVGGLAQLCGCPLARLVRIIGGMVATTTAEAV